MKDTQVPDGPVLCELCGGDHGESKQPCPVVWEAQYGEEGPVETAQQAEQDEWHVVPSAVKPKKKPSQGNNN